ncbi:Cob(I)yrinic acid a,c-diamide adenosyltransferase [Novipirellula aureliae]|uniref:Corrinoid adenosyltransferase n=1 Tax=Novipirellula aureliae TaxID=2527966 RepID=A0A5C6DGK4_9BACT|nr:cob(I)yrinic acid a,c-diamide adenosyltransferase [Novipirellula aureliae]TWU35792.1 Cob(I)yrinic acid a,c-diamide adenosyltransferase [Novipirellula aureliae]
MKIYTRSGDSGSTGLFGGPRVPKDDDRIESYGTVDELNACLGVVRASGVSKAIDGQLQQIQNELFSIGAELATPDADRHDMRIIDNAHIARLEQWIDEHEQSLTPLKTFILPAGALASVQLHLARSVCRRAERRVVTLASHDDVQMSESLTIYLNRLSDLLFVLSRVANQEAGVDEVPWQRPT